MSSIAAPPSWRLLAYTRFTAPNPSRTLLAPWIRLAHKVFRNEIGHSYCTDVATLYTCLVKLG